MLEWLFGKGTKKLEEDTKKSFNSVKEDISNVIKWLKHLDQRDKQLAETVNQLKSDLSTIQNDIESLREGVSLAVESVKSKHVFAKRAVFGKQTAVLGVDDAVQTAVQTGNFYDILRNLTSNERLVVFTLLNAEDGMKLSYEDLAMLLGKEKATIRGQINAIKQKSEGLIEEIAEKNGKKRVFVRADVKEKLSKYAKVRVRKTGKNEKNGKNEEG